jgi:arabinose-5-phosphate isomerase
MTQKPVTIAPTARVSEAMDLLRDRKISELPVVDVDGRPVGMLDITDLIGLHPMGTTTGNRPPLRLLTADAV